VSAPSLESYSRSAGEGEVLIVLYINIDRHEAYADAEIRQSCADEMAQLAADGSAAQAST
jgi:hypothetical protein